jgi:hypothetical protein
MKTSRLIHGVLRAAVVAGLMGAANVSVAQTIGYAEAIDRLAIACGKDIQTYCKGVNLGNNRIRNCLTANDAKVSAQCKSGYANAYAMLEKRAMAQASVLKICDRDISRVCSGVQPGDGNILDCILRAQRTVSAQCNQAVTDAGYR